MNYFKVFMGIDDQLMNRNTDANQSEEEGADEAEKAGEFRAGKRGVTPENTGQEAASIREGVRQSKQAGPKRLTGKTAQRKSLENPFLKMTDGLLKSAWENLIPSWGLTLLWIDVHVFLNKVLGPSAFRDLGEEWIPASIKKLGNEKTKEAAALAAIVEKAGCGCLNLGCLFLVIASLSLVALIVKVFTGNPLESISLILDVLWGWLDKVTS